MRRYNKFAAVMSAIMLTSQAISSVGACEGAVCFVLREQSGKIALFREGSEEPLAVYKTPVGSLYPADIELLREGIRLKNRAEVARLLEDLGVE